MAASRASWAWVPTLYFAEGLPYVLVVTVSVVMFKQLGISNADELTGIKIGIELKNYLQFVIGLGIALTLSLCLAFIPAWCGHSLVGQHLDYNLGTLIYAFFFYLLVIGPVEELVFRVYYQETFILFFKKHKWIGVIIASALFGLWHRINGSFVQVLFTFGIGLVFGFAKYFIRQYKYLGLAFTHGLYDFLNVVVTMFVI